jgi:ATP-dependent DNA helicase RecG
MYHLNSLFLLSYFQNELDMCKIKPRECQNVEFKSSWQDEFLKWICGFANAQGAGFIDTWGRGYKKIHDGFKKAGLPMPTVKSHCGGTLVTFQRGYDVISGRKNVTSGVTSDVSSSVSSLSVVQLTERQKKMRELINKDPFISAQQMSVVLSVVPRTIWRDLSTMQKKGVLIREGNTSAGHWIVLIQE